MFKQTWQKVLLAATFGISMAYFTAHAANIIPPCATSASGLCGLNDFLLIAINVANWILGCVGAIALLFFVYGGFTFILSGGSEKKVEEGKQILMNAIIGLAIVFTSYLIIQFSMSLLGVTGFNGTTPSNLNAFFNTFIKKK